MAARPPPGPARFFADHPVLYATSVALAAGSAVLMEARAALAKGTGRKVGWNLLALLEWGIVAGLLALPRQGEPDGDSSTPSQTL